ncbi:MAG: Calx-beta domain-containing protein [Acidimicrobiia bacterium]
MAGGIRLGRVDALTRRTGAIVALVAVVTFGLVTTTTMRASGAGTPLNVLSTDRVDVSETGGQLTSSCVGYYYGGCGTTLSADGREATFVTADAAQASDTNGNWDVYVRDAVTGTTSRVSLADDGGDAWAIDAAISGTGRYVAFTGCCSLVPGENQPVSQAELTLSAVTGRFYAAPGGNGAFDPAPLAQAPFHTGSYPVVDFNPPYAPSCSNPPGVNDSTIPFTNVVPQPNGSCTTQAVAGAGDTNAEFEATFEGTVAVPAPGIYPIHVNGDDGWLIGIGHRTGGAETPTRVSGPFDTQGTTAQQSLPVLASSNGARYGLTTWIDFPAAGTYPIESDYAECCGGGLAFTLDTTQQPVAGGSTQVYVRDRDTDGNGVFDEPGGTATRLVSKFSVPGTFAGNVDASGSGAWSPHISSDGRFVTFMSVSDNLPGGDLSHAEGYLHDRDPDGNGIFDEPGKELTELVTVSDDGTAVGDLNYYGCGYYGYGQGCSLSVSDDGSAVTFVTYEALDPQDTNGTWDLYVRRRNHADTTLLSTDGAGNATTGGVYYTSAALSANGRFATFTSASPELPGYNGNYQTYLRDRDANQNGIYDEAGDETVELASQNASGDGAAGTTWAGAVSDDGTVAMLSDATDLDATYANPNRRTDAYVRRRDGTVRLASASAETTNYSGVGNVEIASQALVIAFSSDYPDLVQDDTNNAWDVFRVELGSTASAITTSLTSSASSTLPGATSVAISDIPTETRKAFGLDVSTAPSGTRLRPSGTRLRPSGTRLRPSGTRLRPSGTRLRDVGDVTFASVAPRLVHSGPAREAPLSQLEVTTPGGWPTLLADTQYADVPIQSVTIGELLDLLVAGVPPDSALADLRLGDLNVNDSPLAAITPAGFELGTTPVQSLVAQGGGAWCDAFASETGKTCADIGATTGQSLMELDLDPAAALLLAEHPDLRRPEIGPNLAALQSAGAPIVGALLDDMNLGVTRIGDLGLAAAVANPTTGVGAVPLDSLTASERSRVANCSTPSFDCTGATLADALAAGALVPGRTLADAGRHYGTVTVGQLGTDLLGDIEVNDVVTGYLDAADFPWEDLDLVTSGVQEYSDDAHTVDETLAVRIASDGSAPVTADVQMQLPSGFRLDPKVRGGIDPVTLAGPPGALATLVTKTYDDNASHLRWSVTGLQPNTDYQLHVRVLPSLKIGSGQISARVWSAGRSGIASPIGIDVVEPPDPGATAANAGTVTSDRLYFGYLPSGGDVDLYGFTPRTSDSEVGVRLSHLAGDADLVLYGPPSDAANNGPSSAPTRGVAPQVAPIDDEGLDPTSNQVAARPEVSADVPVDPPAGSTVVGKSATSDDVDQEIASGTGASYVQVSTYNGSTSQLPYVLHVHEVSPTPLQACLPYTHPYTGLAGTMPNLGSLTSDLQTVILVDQQRLGDQYPAADVNALIAKLQTLANDPSVKGVVVPVEGSNPSLSGLSGYPDIAGAFAQLNADACNPDAANKVVDRITQLVRGIRSGSLPGVSPHSQLANVVVVGSDSVIPMARVTDTTRAGNESQYADAFDAGTPIGAALASDHFLTDAPFGDLDPIPWLNRRLYVEDLAVGRLVETPQEMSAVVDTYLAPNGKALDPTKAYVAGYDWMKTGAQSVAATLGTRLTQANGGQAVAPGSLITDGWSSANLLGGAGSIGAAQSSITGIYMHADHGTGVAADGTTFAPSELAAALPAGSKLLFSMGCHSGIDDPALADTFPAMLNGVGATYLASTGFGYGDDTGVQLHDRLVNDFADQLDGSVSIGAALTRAKQQYFSSQGLYGAYDDKVLETMTLYGLPMFRIGTGTGGPAVPPDVTPTAESGGVSSASFAYDTSSAGAVDIGMQGALVPHSGANGNWYEVAGSQPLALPGRPVQPRVDHDVTARSSGNLLPAHGALITGLSEPSLPISGFDAAWSRATIDSAADEPELVAGDVAFPARLATVSTYSDPSGAPLGGSGPPQRQRLVVTPARFESSGLRDTTGTGTEDLFSRVAGSVLYSTSTDYTEPDIRDSSATVDPSANTADFGVDASDASGVSRVVVMFRDDTGWKRLDLDPTSGSHWAKSTPVVSAANSVPYFVQAVDGDGNVGVASNKGALFDAGVRPSVSIGDISLGEPLHGSAPATFTVTLSKATSVPVQVDWATSDGTATSLGDYSAGSGTLVFAPGDTSKTISVDVLADEENEPDETFSVQLANATGAAIATGTGTATILGSSSTSVSVGDASASEGDVKNGAIRFHVSLSAPASQPVTVNYKTVAGSATGGTKITAPGVDYKDTGTKTLVFKAGQVSKVVTVAVRADTEPEDDQTFQLQLSDAQNAGIRRGAGIGTIIDDDGATGPRLAIGDIHVVEGNTKQRTAVLTLRFASPVPTDTTVNWSLVPGTATGGAKVTTVGADYVTKSGSILFKARSFAKTVSVVLLPDTTAGEGDQSFTVHLSGPTPDQFLRADATVTILDDD